jgi:hypothetical protein
MRLGIPSSTVDPIAAQYQPALARLVQLHAGLDGLHPSLARLFPVALAAEGQFFVFDLDPDGAQYRLVVQAPTPMPIPEGVRAAFPMECYGGRAACVVTGEVFDTLEGYATILHEFVHCYQWQTCEQQLKQTLGVARQAECEQNMMWELTHPFPYTSDGFRATYQSCLQALEENDAERLAAARARLRRILTAHDYEYLVWQEWKEGLARYIENLVRRRWGLAENHGGLAQPFDRVTFYAGGARWIGALLAAEPSLAGDLVGLFGRLWG